MNQKLEKVATKAMSKGKRTQDDIVYEHIFEAILEQRLAPGTKLNEESLGEIFGVSRTIIRRSLSRLGHEQVVVLRPNRGAVVASPSVDEARQIILARRIIEGAVMELAVENAKAAEIEQLRQLVRDEQDCFARGDKGAGIRLSGEFHIKLAQIANNPPLLSFQRSLVSQCSLIIALYESGAGAKSHCSYDEHFELIDSIERRDAEAAVQLMKLHMDNIENKLSLNDEVSADLKDVFSNVVGS